MSTPRKQITLDVGFAALPIFCSLLGAVLMMTLFTRQSPPVPLTHEQVRQAAREVGRIRVSARSILAAQPEVSNRIDLAEYRLSLRSADRALAALRTEKESLDQQVSLVMRLRGRVDELQRQTETRQEEATRARHQIESLQARLDSARSNAVIGPLGGHQGPFVLVECRGDESVIFPGEQRIPATAPASELESLFAAINRAGFVAVAARPDSFETTYPKLRRAIYQHVETANRGRTQEIGRCSFPLPADASLTQYLPKGNLE